MGDRRFKSKRRLIVMKRLYPVITGSHQLINNSLITNTTLTSMQNHNNCNAPTLQHTSVISQCLTVANRANCERLLSSRLWIKQIRSGTTPRAVLWESKICMETYYKMNLTTDSKPNVTLILFIIDEYFFVTTTVLKIKLKRFFKRTTFLE